MTIRDLKEAIDTIPDHYTVVVAGDAFISAGDCANVSDVKEVHSQSKIELEVEG
tara:strand:+ start:296 stop:457 length:162 start_codon:yes stop_codon:yes gene_type:complete